MGIKEMSDSMVWSVKNVLFDYGLLDEDPEMNLWGDGIKWFSLKEGFLQAYRHKQPLMLLVKNRHCPSCQALREKFINSPELGHMSRDFIMVLADDKELPKDTSFYPDGRYVPRVLFFSPNGALLSQYSSPDTRYKYFHHSVQTVLNLMHQVRTSFYR